MMRLTDITAQISIAFALTVIVFSFVATQRLLNINARGYYALFFLTLLLPLPYLDLPLAAYVRGITGDLSITTLFFLSCGFLQKKAKLLRPSSLENLFYFVFLALSSLLFYPFALGASLYDPYRMGYGNPWFFSFLLGICLLSLIYHIPRVGLVISLSVLAWSVSWYESSNLWDYLIDPFLSSYALFRLLKASIQKLAKHG